MNEITCSATTLHAISQSKHPRKIKRRMLAKIFIFPFFGGSKRVFLSFLFLRKQFLLFNTKRNTDLFAKLRLDYSIEVKNDF